MKVTFGAPPNNGAAITSYAATCTPSNGGIVKTKTGATSPLLVSGLTAGKSYTCSVKATNSRGAGPVSVSSAAITA